MAIEVTQSDAWLGVWDFPVVWLQPSKFLFVGWCGFKLSLSHATAWWWSTGSWRNRWSGWTWQLCCSCFCASNCFYRLPCVRLTLFMMLGDSPNTLQFFLWMYTCTSKCRSTFVYVDYHQQFLLIHIPNLHIQNTKSSVCGFLDLFNSYSAEPFMPYI